MSAGISAFIAHVTFWMLLAYGWFWKEIGVRGVGVFLTLWLGGYFTLQRMPVAGEMFFSFVALLDIVLVFMIFKGDVPLT